MGGITSPEMKDMLGTSSHVFYLCIFFISGLSTAKAVRTVPQQVCFMCSSLLDRSFTADHGISLGLVVGLNPQNRAPSRDWPIRAHDSDLA